MATSKVILVTGATGNVGRIVVRLLVEAGVTVRALTRDPARARLPAGVEVVRGDLAAPEGLAEAMAGVDGLFLFPVPETAARVAELAREAGVRRAVVLSSGAVTNGYDTDYHLPVERAVENAGLAWTHVRPGEFALNKLWLWGPGIRAERAVYEPDFEAAWFPVHERDIADVAAEALLDDRHIGRAHTLNGPQLLDKRAQVAAIASAIGADIRRVTVSPAEARERYLAQGGFAAANADFLLGYEDYAGDELAPAPDAPAFDPTTLPPQPTTTEATGRPPRTFAQWATDHAADFA